jgi:hypothetical protein
MLEQRIRAAGKRPTEADLQKIKKNIYEELLSELCTRLAAVRGGPVQRGQLHDGRLFSAPCGSRWHASLSQPETDARLDAGWSQELINNLAAAVRAGEEEDVEAIPIERIDRQLAALGSVPSDELRWMAQLVAFEGCREVWLRPAQTIAGSNRRP